MNRPRVFAVLSLAAGLLLVVVVLSCSGTTRDAAPEQRSTALTIRDPLAEALRYVPQSAGLVAVVSTDTTQGPLAAALALARTVPRVGALLRQAQALIDERTGLSLATDGAVLAGAPMVIARIGLRSRAQTLGAWVVPDAAVLGEQLSGRVQSGTLTEGASYQRWTTYRQTGLVLAARDRVLLGASDLHTLRAAITRRLRTGRTGGLTVAAFTTLSRAGMPAAQAVVRLAADGPTVRAALADRLRGAGSLPWVAALTGAGVAIAADEHGVSVRARLRTDEASLVDPDVPIALGPVAPELDGDGPVVVGLRDPARTAGVALELAKRAAPDQAAAYAQVRDILKRYARVDLEADVLGVLDGDATLTFPAGGGVTLRAVVNDDQGLRDTLGRLGRVGSVAGIVGALGVGSDVGGLAFRGVGEDRYEVLRNDATVAVLAVRDGVFVASTDPDVDVDAVANAAPTARGEADTPVGALSAMVDPAALAAVLVDRLGVPASARPALAGLGVTSLTARAELSFLMLRADVAVDANP